jgi:NADPH-dependent curcumin reductase CurA
VLSATSGRNRREARLRRSRESPRRGPAPAALVKRASLQGFIILDHYAKLTEVSAQLAEWIADGSLEPLETVVEGFEELPSAINMLFDGANVVKLVVRVRD